MSNVINADKGSKHTIKKFSFESMEVDDNDIVSFSQNPFQEQQILEDTTEEIAANLTQSKQDKQPDNKALLEKIDQLTSDVIALQMELEKKETSFSNQLQETRDESYEKGKSDGMKMVHDDFLEEQESLKTQMIHSITLLDEQKHKFDQAVNSLEEALLQSAFVLAQKVIVKEIDEYSSEIATNIAQSLLETLHESSEVTLKVNPADFSDISSHFKDNHIKIEADDAIQKGGVVILSNSGNIDGNILTRYKQSLQLLQKES